MARLGPKATVRGYLDCVVASALSHEQDDSELPDVVEANWAKLLDDLPAKWHPNEFARRMFDHHAGIGWSFALSQKRGSLGPKANLAFGLLAVWWTPR